VALLVLAVLVAAWLVVGMRAVRLEDQANAVIDRARAGSVPEAEVKRAIDDLGKATDLSPDQGPVIMQGQLYEATGHDQEAVLFAYLAANDEPDNLQAWIVAWAAEDVPEAREQAHDEMLRLNPYIDVVLGLRNCIECKLRTP
jgi:hypothetical protein